MHNLLLKMASEQDNATNLEQQLEIEFNKAGDIFDSLDDDSFDTYQRERILGDGTRIAVTRIQSSATSAFFIRVGEIAYYLSKKGVLYFSPPKLRLHLGTFEQNIPVGQLDVPEDKRLDVTREFSDWTQRCVNENRLVSYPMSTSFAGSVH